MRRSRALGLISIAWLVWVPSPADACICIAVGPACQTFWAADAVFSGTVVAIEPGLQDPADLESSRVRMSVTRAYRGVTSESIEIFTGQGGGDCGYEFVVGEAYLVYANRTLHSKVLTTGICSHTTRALADAQDDLRYLDNLDTLKPGTRVFGEVLHIEDAAGSDDKSRSPAIGFRVRLVGEVGTFEALSDEQGEVRFDGVPVGRYTATVVPRPQFAAVFDSSTVSLPDPRACAAFFFAVRYDGRIDGRLVDPVGASIAQTTIQLRSAEDDADDRSYDVVSRCDESQRSDCD